MKKIHILLYIFLVFSACGKLEDLNKNTKDPSSVSGESLFTYAQKKVVDQVVSANVNLNISRLINQYWCETTYPQESQYDLTNRSIPDNHWDVLYRDALKNFKEATKVLNATPLGSESQEVRNNKLAIIEIMTVYTYSVLVETFGDIPYSEALDPDKPTPKYDDGKTVYEDLINRLTAAIGTMDDTQAGFGTADNIYSGSSAVKNWKKFANSLKLKMGMVLADVDNTFAKTTVESAVSNVFTSNADNAAIKYLGAQPNTNPIYVDLVASARNDFVIATTIADTMNNLDDPRLFTFMTNPLPFKYRIGTNGAKQDSVVPAGGIGRVFIYKAIDGTDSVVFKQAPYTILASDSLKAKFYQGGKIGASNDYSLFSQLNPTATQPTFPGTILTYSEVEFLLAEAVERGYNVGGTAESHYNNAITASILEWKGTAADATKYLANPDVAYSTAKGDFKQKIGIQKWIALFNQGLDSWTEIRRLDVPKLKATSTAKSVFPVRFYYPIEEQTLNGENRKAAATAIGGDNVGTKLFWDKF